MLGLQYSHAPGGRKPIWLIDFDNNPDPESPEGQGVCEKLDGVQEETDTIHNLGIESGKRGCGESGLRHGEILVFWQEQQMRSRSAKRPYCPIRMPIVTIISSIFRPPLFVSAEV
jgi:hypothetical protein